MAQKSIVTQAQLGALKLALAQEADSLVFHSGDSMSKAHGFNVINGPADDGEGNDLSAYKDSNGDVVGTSMLHVVVNNVDYYAPISPTNLSGQDPTASLVPDLSSLLQPGANTWVTEYTSDAVSNAQLCMTGLLLPHTQQYYAEVHAAQGFSAVSAFIAPTTVLDSAGHTIGTHILQLFFNQKKLWLPCSTRLGGPAQPPVLPLINNLRVGITTKQNSYENHVSAGKDDVQLSYVWYNTPIAGTLPITFKWQINQKTDGSGAWNDVPLTPPGPLPIPNDKGDASNNYTINGNQIKLRTTSGNDSARLWVVIRGVYTNVAGDFPCNLCHVKVYDTDGGIFSGPDTNTNTYYEVIPTCQQPPIHCTPVT